MLVARSVFECPSTVQARAVEALQLEWPGEFPGADAAVLQDIRRRYLDTVALVDAHDRVAAIACVGLHSIDEKNTSPVGGEFWISNVLVKPELRRMGLGKAVLAAAERALKARGATVASLWCYDDLVPFYQRCGWSKAGPFQGRDAATVMVRFL